MQYPFEFAKTRAQLQAFKSSSTNPFSVIIQTARQDGIRSIYTGCSTLVLGTTFKAGVRFLSFDYIKNMLVDDHGRLSASRGVLAGMVAGAVESIVAVTPTERIKIALYVVSVLDRPGAPLTFAASMTPRAVAVASTVAPMLSPSWCVRRVSASCTAVSPRRR